MDINKQDILTLDDKNEYVVVSKVFYQNYFYYYIVDINNPTNLKFVKEDNDELLELKDKELVTNLVPLFLANTNNYLA